MPRFLAALLFVGCVEAPGAPCEHVGDPLLQVAPSDVAFADYVDGDPIPVGIPPQGGAPYTPLHARVVGLYRPDLGVDVEVTAVDDDDGSELGEVTTNLRLLCANVGASAGTWLAADVHLRYPGWPLEDLPGRTARLTMVARDTEGTEVQTTLVGSLEAL